MVDLIVYKMKKMRNNQRFRPWKQLVYTTIDYYHNEINNAASDGRWDVPLMRPRDKTHQYKPIQNIIYGKNL